MSRARGIVARYGQCADTERGYGGLGRVYQSLAKSDALIVNQCDGATPRDRAALDGKTVRRQRPATVRQRVALPYNRSVMGPMPPVEQVRPGMSGVFAFAAACLRNVGATCATWLRCTVYNPRSYGSHLRREPAYPTYSSIGQVERDDAAQANVPRSPIPPAAGPRATTYNPRWNGSLSANEPAPEPRESAREWPPGVFGAPDCRKGAIALYGALTRSQGASRETHACPWGGHALSPHGRPVRRDAGVPGWFSPSERGGHSAALSVAVGRA